MIAALFVEKDGAYFGIPGVDAWDRERDARKYAGPHPIVAHPPCERWGHYWHGSPRKPHQYELGADDGCFAAALAAVRRFGGVLEHPAYSRAWRWHGLQWPVARGGWWPADKHGGMTCHVEQGHYGHLARKATWLYAVAGNLPEFRWGPSPQRIHPVALARHGYAKARRTGVMAYIGGGDKSKIRAATPAEFRDLLLSIAASRLGPDVVQRDLAGDRQLEQDGDRPRHRGVARGEAEFMPQGDAPQRSRGRVGEL